MVGPAGVILLRANCLFLLRIKLRKVAGPYSAFVPDVALTAYSAVLQSGYCGGQARADYFGGLQGF